MANKWTTHIHFVHRLPEGPVGNEQDVKYATVQQ